MSFVIKLNEASTPLSLTFNYILSSTYQAERSRSYNLSTTVITIAVITMLAIANGIKTFQPKSIN